MLARDYVDDLVARVVRPGAAAFAAPVSRVTEEFGRAADLTLNKGTCLRFARRPGPLRGQPGPSVAEAFVDLGVAQRAGPARGAPRHADLRVEAQAEPHVRVLATAGVPALCYGVGVARPNARVAAGPPCRVAGRFARACGRLRGFGFAFSRAGESKWNGASHKRRPRHLHPQTTRAGDNCRVRSNPARLSLRAERMSPWKMLGQIYPPPVSI